MRFTSRSETEAFFAPLGIGPRGPIPGGRLATQFKTDHLCYGSRLSTAPEVALALMASQGDFMECAIWAFALPLGDRSLDPDATDWNIYARWRQKHGESKSLHEVPGHSFKADEGFELAKLIEMAIYMGWDAFIAARPSKILIELSHDDRITIYSRSRQTDLIAKLARLGVSRV